MLCLCCQKDITSPTRPEHIVPESLGNKKFVLNGVVCDTCNSYFSKLEEYFIHHHLSSARRLLTVPETKKGKPPSQRLKAGRADSKPGGQIVLRQGLVPGHESEQMSITVYANEVHIQASYLLDDADAKKLSRALAKFALETLYFKKGDLAYSSEFDPLRRYARYGDTLPFVPFLWRFQNEITCDVVVTELTHKTKGVFIFATVAIPGSIYFIPCSRFNDSTAIDKLAEVYTLDKVLTPGMLKRNPLKIDVRLASQDQNGTSGQNSSRGGLTGR